MADLRGPGQNSACPLSPVTVTFLSFGLQASVVEHPELSYTGIEVGAIGLTIKFYLDISHFEI